jgi:hypothetical protein
LQKMEENTWQSCHEVSYIAYKTQIPALFTCGIFFLFTLSNINFLHFY